MGREPAQDRAKGGVSRKNAGSRYELLLHTQLKALGMPLPTPDFRFHPGRRWEFDFAWPDVTLRGGSKLSLEIEGGVWMKSGGAHRSGNNYVLDLEKYNQAALDGWLVLRVLPEWLSLESGKAAFMLEEALKQEVS